ncbi:MAG: sulfurtransferase TusA family protein, partial [Thaumarchaeota archaeon]|nr:sulfurtransferase TusA family protein [Nitrososphaerota archaeon]
LLDEIITRRLVDEKFLRPLSHRPAANLVHRPPDRSYSVISMVWGATQAFPIHDHLSWGLIGVYQNSIREERYERLDDGSKEGYAEIKETEVTDFQEGQILEEGLVFDELHRNDIHRILNPTGKPSVSIHILASDLGMKRRHQYDPVNRTVKKFVSGYDDPDGRLEGRVVAGNDASQIIGAVPHATLDTRGQVCPYPTIHTVAKLDEVGKGEILEVLTDSEDSAYDEIPAKLKSKGLEFVVLELPAGFWKVRVRS